MEEEEAIRPGLLVLVKSPEKLTRRVNLRSGSMMLPEILVDTESAPQTSSSVHMDDEILQANYLTFLTFSTASLGTRTCWLGLSIDNVRLHHQTQATGAAMSIRKLPLVGQQVSRLCDCQLSMSIVKLCASVSTSTCGRM